MRPPTKFAVVLSSYGWGGGAIKQLQELLSGFKIEVAGALEISGPPRENDIKKIVEMGKWLASKIKWEG